MSRLVVAVSSRALFNLEDAHRVFERDGLDAYTDFQTSEEPVLPGAAFPVVKALADAAREADAPIDVIVVSRNNPTNGLRIVRAIESAGLHVAKGCFTGGNPIVPYLQAFGTHLFLTKAPLDASDAIAGGVPAALMHDPPDGFIPGSDEIRIAFDGDSCLFSDEADRVFEAGGLAAFQEHEREHAKRELPRGPLAPFLEQIGRLEKRSAGKMPFRIALVTARIGAARERALMTLKAWGVSVDEAFFLGGESKSKFVAVFKPHIFFDDRDAHLLPAAKIVPSARVPSADDGEAPTPVP